MNAKGPDHNWHVLYTTYLRRLPAGCTAAERKAAALVEAADEATWQIRRLDHEAELEAFELLNKRKNI